MLSDRRRGGAGRAPRPERGDRRLACRRGAESTRYRAARGAQPAAGAGAGPAKRRRARHRGAAREVEHAARALVRPRASSAQGPRRALADARGGRGRARVRQPPWSTAAAAWRARESASAARAPAGAVRLAPRPRGGLARRGGARRGSCRWTPPFRAPGERVAPGAPPAGRSWDASGRRWPESAPPPAASCCARAQARDCRLDGAVQVSRGRCRARPSWRCSPTARPGRRRRRLARWGPASGPRAAASAAFGGPPGHGGRWGTAANRDAGSPPPRRIRDDVVTPQRQVIRVGPWNDKRHRQSQSAPARRATRNRPKLRPLPGAKTRQRGHDHKVSRGSWRCGRRRPARACAHSTSRATPGRLPTAATSTEYAASRIVNQSGDGRECVRQIPAPGGGVIHEPGRKARCE